jgi:hypothetical protein
MSLRSILSIPVKLPQKIEAYLPTGAPSIAGVMNKAAEQIPDVGGTSQITLPKLAPIVASVEEHIPHPPGMEIANVVQKMEFPVVSRVEAALAGQELPAAPPASQGLIPLTYE